MTEPHTHPGPSSPAAPGLSVVIPMYREAARIGPTLVDVIRTLAPGEFGTAEIILVDDGSEDATPEACRRAVEEHGDGRIPVRLIRFGINRGKGAAVRDGLAAAAGEFRLIMDADNSARVDQLPRLIEAMERSNAHLAVGSRSMPDSVVSARASRRLAGAVFKTALRLMGLNLARDTQCGFKLYSRHAAELVVARSVENGFCFDIEHMLIIRRAGLGVEEVGIRWTHADGGQVRPVRDGVRMLKEARRIASRLRTDAPTLDSFTGLARPHARATVGVGSAAVPTVGPSAPRPAPTPTRSGTDRTAAQLEPKRTYPKSGTRAGDPRERVVTRPIRVEELRPLPPPPAPVRPF